MPSAIIIILISLLKPHFRRTCLHNKNITNETEMKMKSAPSLQLLTREVSALVASVAAEWLCPHRRDFQFGAHDP